MIIARVARGIDYPPLHFGRLYKYRAAPDEGRTSRGHSIERKMKREKNISSTPWRILKETIESLTRLRILTISFSHSGDLRSRIVVFRRSLSFAPRWRAATRWFSAVTTAAMACPTAITAISMDTLDPPDTKFCRRSRFRYTRCPPRRCTWTHPSITNCTVTNTTIKITITT